MQSHLSPAQPAKKALLRTRALLITRNAALQITVAGTGVWCAGGRVKRTLSLATLGDQEQTLTPRSTGIQKAICPARLISSCEGDKAMTLASPELSPDCLYFYRDQKPYRE